MNVGMTPVSSLFPIFREDIFSNREKSVMCGNGGRPADISEYNRLRANLGRQLLEQLLHRPGARDDRATRSYGPDSVVSINMMYENDMLC